MRKQHDLSLSDTHHATASVLCWMWITRNRWSPVDLMVVSKLSSTLILRLQIMPPAPLNTFKKILPVYDDINPSPPFSLTIYSITPDQ
ncbi:hypothetical protein PoB_001011100 [Plakobranchus ocellatus]|uniref:Uncharacterized protein n=1 Tax=Plakobranchus ocellatus TaxID=259542 RepID=A0AAV3YMH3_9GAST|nr:hypothetical protein PoB_001011100 [Plakobranchus ocellatus]